MLTKTISPNDFHFELLVRVDARNCRQLAIRLLAALGALAVLGSKIVGVKTESDVQRRQSTRVHISFTEFPEFN